MTAGGNQTAGELLAVTLGELMGSTPPLAFAEHVQVDWGQRDEVIEALNAMGAPWRGVSLLRAQAGQAWLTLAPPATLVAGIAGQALLEEDAREAVEPRLGFIMWDILAVDVLTRVSAMVDDARFGQPPVVSPLAETLGTLLAGNADEWGLPTGSVFPDVDLGVRQATHSLLKVLRDCPELWAVARSLHAPERRGVTVSRPPKGLGRTLG